METKKLARLISITLYPAITGTVFTYVLFLGLMGLNVSSFIYASIYAFLITILPFLILKILVGTGKLDGIEVVDKKKRRIFFNASSPSYILSLLILFLIGIPRVIILAGIGSFLIILVYYLVSPYYKISIHVGILAFSVMVVSLVFGAKYFPLDLLLPVLIWSRVKLQRHTLGESLLSVLIGSMIPLILLKLFI
ncbi:hypothetical protein KKI19_00270 [Patescibacteria group bacterium]|nr:hypothetical protein [Patescibacteria group bacterium]